MTSEIPIGMTRGIELTARSPGVATANITNAAAAHDLPWDRYVRLKAAAQAVSAVNAASVLDAGGYDGALKFFLPGVSIDVIDPATTGGSVLCIPLPDQSYDAVVAVDVLEHIHPKDRKLALSEFARVARYHVIINYPCVDSKAAQEIALELTDNPLLREHVQWDLPDSNSILVELAEFGFSGTVHPHTSIAIWLGQYVTQNLAPEVAQKLNRHLILNFADEPSSRYLYHLVLSRRG